jgi:arginyl-tRNA synthetase
MPEGWQTTDLEKILIQFPEVVQHAIEQWSPHFIVTYLLIVAQAFNSWYGNTKILDDNDPTSAYKVALTAAFAQTMTNGLHLLGIAVPEKM